jgi:hypothetical protein
MITEFIWKFNFALCTRYARGEFRYREEQSFNTEERAPNYIFRKPEQGTYPDEVLSRRFEILIAIPMEKERMMKREETKLGISRLSHMIGSTPESWQIAC